VTEISDWSDIEAQLQETKGLLEEIEQRFQQVRRDSLKQNELLTQKEQIRELIQDISSDRSSASNKNQKIRRKPNSRNDRSSPHKEELLKQLDAVTEQLEQIEADLESRLLSWSSFREPFWLIVRFVGIGIIIGVILRSCPI
jgi:chromosome segregation ATPase